MIYAKPGRVYDCVSTPHNVNYNPRQRLWALQSRVMCLDCKVMEFRDTDSPFYKIVHVFIANE